ncbi:hypothetical protein Tco_0980644 [Tanacetum coccineum]
MEYVKKSNDKRALHKREYDSRVNKRQMQTTEENVDTRKALDASLVDTKSSGTESLEQDTSSRSGNDAHVDDAYIKPKYNKEPMAEVQLIVDHNVFATGQQYSSNDMVHNHYLKEAKNKTHDMGRNSKPSVMPSARSQSTAMWIPTGKIFDSSTTKVDSEPPNGSNEDITNPYECEQTLNGFKEFKSDKQAMTSDHNSSELGIHDHNNEPSSSKLVPKVVPSADTTAPSKQELDLLFGPLYDEFFTAGTSCVNKSSSPTDNSTQQDTPPSGTAQSTIELITLTTTITAEDNM